MSFDKNGDGQQVLAASVHIAREVEEVWGHCVAHELSHAFGMLGDGVFGVETAFGDVEMEGLGYTPHDLAAFWIAYHPELRDGMDWAEAEPIIRRLVAEGLQAPADG